MFWKQLGSRSLIVFTNQISVLFVTLILANRLGLDNYGIWATSIIIIQIFSILLDGGFFIPVVNELHLLNNSQKIGNIWIEIYLLKLFIFFVIAVIFLLINYKVNIFIDLKLLILTFLCALSYGLYPLWFYQAINKVEHLVIPNFIGRLIFILIPLLYVDLKEDIYLVLIAQILSFVLPFLFSLYDSKSLISNAKPPKFQSLKARLIKSIPYFIGNSFLYQTHNLWGVTLILFANLSQIGIFQLADSFLRAGQAFIAPISENLLIKHRQSKIIQQNILKKISLIIILISFVSYLLLDKLVLILGDSFYLAIPTLSLSILVWTFISAINITNYPIIGILISDKISHQLYFIYGVINLIAIIIFIKFINITAYNLELFFLIINIFFTLICFFLLVKYRNKY